MLNIPVLQCLLLQSFVFAQDIPFAEFAFTSMHKHPFYATLQKQGPPKITGKHAKMSKHIMLVYGLVVTVDTPHI
jgi:hypothetical protein